MAGVNKVDIRIPSIFGMKNALDILRKLDLSTDYEYICHKMNYGKKCFLIQYQSNKSMQSGWFKVSLITPEQYEKLLASNTPVRHG